jgi:hypothetical protein
MSERVTVPLEMFGYNKPILAAVTGDKLEVTSAGKISGEELFEVWRGEESLTEDIPAVCVSWFLLGYTAAFSKHAGAKQSCRLS